MLSSRWLKWCFVLSLLLSVSSGWAQGGIEPSVWINPAASSDDDHALLRALIPLYEQTAREGKPEIFKPYLDPEFSGIVVTGDAVEGFSGLQEYWDRMGKTLGDGGQYQVKVNLAGPAIITGNIAVAHGTTQDTVLRGGKEYHFDGQWSAVLRKDQGQWKLLRMHASMYPISNPFVSELVWWAKLLWGTIAGIGGLLIGWVLHVIFAKRRKTCCVG